MALYYMCIHRTIYDGCGSMEYRRYLQCIDGNPESDSLACTQQVIVKETKAFTEKLNVEEKNQRILKGMNVENA